MPGRILATRHTDHGSRFAVVGALLLGGWTCIAPVHAAPFEAVDGMPSVLAVPMDDPLSHGRTPDDGPSTRVWDGSSTSVASDGPIDGLGQTVFDCPDTSGHAVCQSEDVCCPGVVCDPPGLLQYLGLCHGHAEACWVGRADALILWRSAPPGPTIVDNDLVTGGALDATRMQSPAAAGPRFSLFRMNKCTGNGLEATYFRAANFRSLRPLGELPVQYSLPDPGIYGNAGLTFDTANADLGARIQSFEFNRHVAIFPSIRFLAGFRWIEWQEQFSMQADSLGGVSDYFQTACVNDLYGGQIGLDANLLALL